MKAKNVKINDELYLEILRLDKSYIQTRWTITTFFLSVSFAIFGFSLTANQNTLFPSQIQHLAAVAIYWFAYFLNSRFYDYTDFLRSYLEEMEATGRTTLDIQSRGKEFMAKRGKPSTPNLLFWFGLIYTLGVLSIWIIYLY